MIGDQLTDEELLASGEPEHFGCFYRIWPAGETSMSFRFPRDVSSWCRLDRQSVGIVASVSFPVAWSGTRGPIAEAADKWARHFASSPQTCTNSMSRAFCEHTAQRIAIRGDRAAATRSNDIIVQLRRSAPGEWLIDGIGPVGAVGPDAAAERRLRGSP